MTDKELLYIKTIAEEKNITRAAEILHIAQPSLTQCIQRIEKSLKCPLFYRKKNGLILTDTGKLYYQTACRILKLWEDFSDEVSSHNLLKRGCISIGASWYNTLLILTDILPRYTKNYPDIDVQLVEKNTAELQRLLSHGEIDIILIHQYPDEYPGKKESDSKKLVYRPLLRESFCIVAHEKFRLSPETETSTDRDFPLLNLKKISDIPFIRFSDNQRIRHISDFIFQQAEISPPICLSTYGFPSAFEMVCQGMGITFLPELYARQMVKDHNEIRLFRIDDIYCAYWIATVCYYQSEYLPVTVQAFLDLIND